MKIEDYPDIDDFLKEIKKRFTEGDECIDVTMEGKLVGTLISPQTLFTLTTKGSYQGLDS